MTGGDGAIGRAQAQTTYATLQPVEGGWAVRVQKQKIWVDSVVYELFEIYGVENCSTGNTEEDASQGKECVVCLSEPRDTTVLPCRHMCMCSGCARRASPPEAHQRTGTERLAMPCCVSVP